MHVDIKFGDVPIAADAEGDLSPADFLKNVANRLFRLPPAATGMDQYHAERIWEIARAMERRSKKKENV